MNQKARLLDIAMNLTRIGNWAADDYEGKKKRIELFLSQTDDYITAIDSSMLPTSLVKTFDRFLKEFELLKKKKERNQDVLLWAEKMMTWGNILTHRTKLLDTV